jgi:lysophospholipase L1-like esterase
MGGGLGKVVVGAVLLVIVGLAAVGGYLAMAMGVVEAPPGLAGVFQPRGRPLSQEAVSRSQAVERKLEEAARDGSTFYLELSDAELTALLASRLDQSGPVRDARVAVTPTGVGFSGNLNGRVPVPFSGTVQVAVVDGSVELELTSLSMGKVPVPTAVVEEDLRPLVARALDIGESLQQAGAVAIQEVSLGDGSLTVVGIQRDGAIVSESARSFLQEAATAKGVEAAPAPPGGETVPHDGPPPGEAPEVYLALGDSLAAGQGAPTVYESYVLRFHQYLARATGRPLGLVNLGRRKESSITIRERQLPRALEEIRARRDDGDPATRVSVVTLDLGANDLVRHIVSQECREAPRGEVCQARIRAALHAFETNFQAIVSEIAVELEPGTEFYVMTVYNPFDFGVGLPLEAFSNEVLEEVNATIRAIAEANGATAAEAGAVMAGHAGGWTHMLDKGDVHPNALGHQALAYALEEARRGRVGEAASLPPVEQY